MKSFSSLISEVKQSPADKEFTKLSLGKPKKTTEDGVPEAVFSGEPVKKDTTVIANKTTGGDQMESEQLDEAGRKKLVKNDDDTLDDAGADKTSQAMAESLQPLADQINQLDETQITALLELSNKTVYSYLNKAMHQRFEIEDKTKEKQHSKAEINKMGRLDSKRADGIDAAVKRLRKEGVDLSTQDLDVLSELDEEELQELSKATLGSYIKKASDRKNDLGYHTGKAGAKGDFVATQNYNDADRKHTKGIKRAVKKLVGEGVEINHVLLAQLNKLNEEELDEVSKGTLSSFIEKASKRHSHSSGIAKAAKKISEPK